MKKITTILLGSILLIASVSACGQKQPKDAILTDPPQTFLCQEADLPAGGGYLLPSESMMYENTNENLLVSGSEGEQTYIEATGRLDGWAAQFKRQTNETSLPEQIYCSSVQYATMEGASLSVREYSSATRGLEGWEITSDVATIGDESVVLRYRSSDPAEQRIWLVIEFSYYNYVVDIGGLGPESSVRLVDLEQVARSVLAHLQAGKLRVVTPVP
jgi:hypothetical protein